MRDRSRGEGELPDLASRSRLQRIRGVDCPLPHGPLNLRRVECAVPVAPFVRLVALGRRRREGGGKPAAQRVQLPERVLWESNNHTSGEQCRDDGVPARASSRL